MFKEFVEKNRYSFHEGFDDWRDAVRAACKPLLDDGTIEQEYIDAIISRVEELGPYIVIAPNICIPHSYAGIGVHDTAMCFMKTEQPVHFDPNDPDKDARIFVVLSATDEDVHLNNLMNLSGALSDDEVVARILDAKTPEDLTAIDEILPAQDEEFTFNEFLELSDEEDAEIDDEIAKSLGLETPESK